jgi:hypothetical protein
MYNGYTYYCTLESKCQLNGSNQKKDFSHVGKNFKVNDKYGAYFNQKKGTISFYRNGSLLGIAFENIKDINLKLVPVVDCYEDNAKFQFIKPNFK